MSEGSVGYRVAQRAKLKGQCGHRARATWACGGPVRVASILSGGMCCISEYLLSFPHELGPRSSHSSALMRLINPASFSLHACRYFLIKRGRRPAMLQKMIDMRKRLRGPPTSGTISIVVTDIEGFSGDERGCIQPSCRSDEVPCANHIAAALDQKVCRSDEGPVSIACADVTNLSPAARTNHAVLMKFPPALIMQI